MRRILAAAILAALLLSCEPAVQRSITLAFNDAADLVTISATTTLGKAKPGTPEFGQIEDERQALLGGRDEWSVRFAYADPESDRVVMQRTHGELQSVEHSATIASENLQKFFFDTHLTITFARGEGWAELTIYPGTSVRATRQQRERVEKLLQTYSERAARYFTAVRSLYTYLDEKPQRATDLFTAIFRDEKDPPARISEQEQSFVDGVRVALEALMSSDEAGSSAVDRDFDFVFNPFPAEVKAIVRGDVLASEGFTKVADRSFAIKMTGALEAVPMLEGRWITPDPLALAFAAPNDTRAEDLAARIADLPRRAQPVVAPSEIAAALMEKMRPAPRYRLRWITRKD